MARVEDMLQKMIRLFDASYEHAMELRIYLANIGEKMDAQTFSIGHLKLQMAKLSTSENPRQPGTLPRNTIQNLKNDRHCVAFITRRGKKTIEPSMPHVVKDDMRKDKKVVKLV